MYSTTLPNESRLTPQHSLLTDEIGNEVYASHYAERKLSRFVIGTEDSSPTWGVRSDLLSGPSSHCESLHPH